MTTPSREEAPERVWVLMGQDHPRTFYWERPGPTHPVAERTVEYLRADLANREPSEGDVERLADRIEARMGPVFGSPEYLADPVKLARAEKRRRDSAVSFATMALEECRRNP